MTASYYHYYYYYYYRYRLIWLGLSATGLAMAPSMLCRMAASEAALRARSRSAASRCICPASSMRLWSLVRSSCDRSVLVGG